MSTKKTLEYPSLKTYLLGIENDHELIVELSGAEARTMDGLPCNLIFEKENPFEIKAIMALTENSSFTMSLEGIASSDKAAGIILPIKFAYILEAMRQSNDNQNEWHKIKASSYWRKAGIPIRAIKETEGVSYNDNRMLSALYSTRGAAYKDYNQLKKAESFAQRAIELNEEAFHGYYLMGAILFLMGKPLKGFEFFEKGQALQNSNTQLVDYYIKDAYSKSEPGVKAKISSFLQRKDPDRFSWCEENEYDYRPENEPDFDAKMAEDENSNPFWDDYSFNKSSCDDDDDWQIEEYLRF